MELDFTGELDVAIRFVILISRWVGGLVIFVLMFGLSIVGGVGILARRLFLVVVVGEFLSMGFFFGFKEGLVCFSFWVIRFVIFGVCGVRVGRVRRFGFLEEGRDLVGFLDRKPIIAVFPRRAK